MHYRFLRYIVNHMVPCGFFRHSYCYFTPSLVFTSIPFSSKASCPQSDHLHLPGPLHLPLTCSVFPSSFLPRGTSFSHFPYHIACILLFSSLLLPNPPILAAVPFYFPCFCNYYGGGLDFMISQGTMQASKRERQPTVLLSYVCELHQQPL